MEIVIILGLILTGITVLAEIVLTFWGRTRLIIKLSKACGRAAIRKTIIYVEMKYKGKINLRLNKIISEYSLHEGICLIDPVPREISISYGTTHMQIFDGDRLHSGFKVYGLSGFSRLIASSGEEKSSFWKHLFPICKKNLLLYKNFSLHLDIFLL